MHPGHILAKLVVILRADQESSRVVNLTACIVGMFNLEIDNGCFVHRSVLSHLNVAHSHEHVKGCIGFVLAVADAGLLSRGFCGEIFRIHTVQVTTAEKKLW